MYSCVDHNNSIFGIDVRTVGDMGKLPTMVPSFHFPSVPLTFETLFIILPYALPMAVVGLLESLMTATIVDEFTDTTSDSNKECKGQGIANILAGLFGGMAGCAMIGQSVINVKSGGRGRLSALVAGVFLLVVVVFLSQWLKIIPMAALVAIMIMVSIGTFNWDSVKNLRSYPLSTNAVMITTVIVVVFTHNLALGVFAGVLLASLFFFASKISRFMYMNKVLMDESRHRKYEVHGQVFFNSSDKFLGYFDFKENVKKVTIDLSQAYFWDVSAVTSLNKAIQKFKSSGVETVVLGLNEASQGVVDQLTDKNSKELLISSH